MRLLWILLIAAFPSQEAAVRRLLHQTVDLARGEAQEIPLSNGAKVTVKLLDLEETKESICSAVWLSRVKVDVDGKEIWLTAGTYNLPVTVGAVQIDCTVTRGPYENAADDYWSLEKDARLRVWPAGSPLLEPGTFVYPVRQRWFAADTQISNEPVIVDARPGKLYYHSGLDLGGAEGLTDVVSATDGLVVCAGKEFLAGHEKGSIPGYKWERYNKDQVFVLDDRGWYHGYVHLKTIDVRAGQKVTMGQKLGLLGKEGGSGGWAHLHYEIRRLMPNGKWGTENGYPFLREAYIRQYEPPLLAVAGPIHHQLAAVGQPVQFDGSLSRSNVGDLTSLEWSGATPGAKTSKTYEKPGYYTETLKVVDSKNNVDYDFAFIEVIDPKAPKELPPRLHAACAPTFGLKPGDPVTFQVRTWNTQEGQETWDFGDGTPGVTTLSGNAYAETVHRYEKPGRYLARVERSASSGAKGTAVLQVRVGEPGVAGDKRWQGLLDRRLIVPDEAKAMMSRFVDRHLTPLPLPESREAWTSKREGLRKQILETLGIDDLVPFKDAPVLRPLGTIQRNGYRIEKLTFEAWPGMAISALLYIPDGLKGRAPGIVSITGHTNISKAADYIQRRNVNLALRGCVVLCYDYFGFGDRKTGDHPNHSTGGNDHDLRSFSFSRRSAAGLEALEGIRAIDVLLTRSDVDPERIGFTGESGGSNTTYWTAALDPRLKLAVPVCSVTTFDYWIRTNVNWEWHQRPDGIRRIADIGTLLALHAPNPLLVISSKRRTDDQEFPVEEAEKSHQWAKHVYGLLGAETAVAHVESTTAHGYQEDKRRLLYGWVEKWLQPPSPKGDVELPVQPEKIEDLRCPLPEGTKTFHDIHAELVKDLPRTTAGSEARTFLRARLGLPDPLPPVTAEDAGREELGPWSVRFWVFESEPGVRLTGTLLGRTGTEGSIVLLPGRDREAAARALDAGHRVFTFEPRGTGETREGGYAGNTWGDRTSNWAWFWGRPWPGQWALDVLQAARFCREKLGAPSVTVEATNEFGWPCLLAGSAAPEILSSGSARIPWSSLQDIVKARGDKALADVPGLLEHLDVPQLRALWPDGKVEVKP